MDTRENCLLVVKSENISCSVLPDSLWPLGLWPTRLLGHGALQARILEWVAFPSPGDLPHPGIKPRSPALQSDSLPSELSGNPTRELSSSYDYSIAMSISPWVLQRDWNARVYQACWLVGGHSNLRNSLMFTECTITKQCKTQLPFMSIFYVYDWKTFLISLNSAI